MKKRLFTAKNLKKIILIGETRHLLSADEDPANYLLADSLEEAVAQARQFAEEYAGDSPIKAAVDNGDELSSKLIFDAAKDGDFFANHIVDMFARYLGLACSHVANTLNPSKIVVVGGVSAAGTFLLDKIQVFFNQYVFPPIKDTTQLVLAELGNDAGVIGAAQLVRLALNKD